MSDLPTNIIECILDRLPIRDAVATSILSKEWRHKWTRIPNLVFDNEFAVSLRLQNEVTMDVEYSNIIGKILLLHVGPIHKFFLRIPSFVWKVDLVSWMHFISRKDVKELAIEALEDIKLPSYIFNCSELQSLKIKVSRLDLPPPPQDFGGFCNLRCLDLCGKLDGTQISNLVSKCPLLERLSIYCVKHTFVIDAPKLVSLRARYLPAAFLELKNVQSLTSISVKFDERGLLKFCQLFDIIGSLLKVGSVTLSSLWIKKDMPRDAPTSLPATHHKLRCLTLLKIDMSSPQCIHIILCILKSSPNLQKLNLGILSSAYIMEDALQILDMQIKKPQTLNSLITVKIKGCLGSEVAIMFIKLILSCTPVLEALYLMGEYIVYLMREDIVNEEEFTFMSEVLKCKRSSPQAQVMYSRYPGDSSIFNFKSLKA
ncbi:unnamed protein product [Rhodiola kirilowii]